VAAAAKAARKTRESFMLCAAGCCCRTQPLTPTHFDLVTCCLYCTAASSHHHPRHQKAEFATTSADGDGYGELTSAGFQSLQRILADLGSGTGKLVLQALLEFNVKTAIGIELGEARHHFRIPVPAPKL